MPLFPETRNALAGSFIGIAPSIPLLGIALHNVLMPGPTDTGTEVSGGSPSYSRLAPTWNFPSNGQLVLASPLTFHVPSGVLLCAGLWTALSGGTFLGYYPFYQGPQLGGSMETSGTVISYGHGLTVGDALEVIPLPGDAAPSGITPGLFYVLTAPTADTVTISTSRGGSTATPSVAGQLFLRKVLRVNNVSSTTFTLANLTIVF